MCAWRPEADAREGNVRRAREYDLYLPLHYNDGTPIERDKLVRVRKHLADRFGGLTFFPQRNEGIWQIGTVVFREDIVILRVVSEDSEQSEGFLRKLKEELRHDLRQEEVLITARVVEIL